MSGIGPHHLPESHDNAEIASYMDGPIIDSAGNSWRMTVFDAIALNGRELLTVPGGTHNSGGKVKRLAYVEKSVWCLAVSDSRWHKASRNGDQWGSGTDSPVPSDNIKTVLARLTILEGKVDQIMPTLDDILNVVTTVGTNVSGLVDTAHNQVIPLLNELKTLADQGQSGDPAKIQSVLDSLTATANSAAQAQTDLANALTADTPVTQNPAPTPQPAP